MVNYNLAKIYKITCNTTGLCYIGSTCNKYLCNRLAVHNAKYKYYLNENKEQHFISVFKVLENKNASIELIENFPCENKKELFDRERYWIENTECVNKINPIRTKEDNSTYTKNYREKHKDRISTFMKNYREKVFNCACGSTDIKFHHKSRHLKTLKHLEYIKKINV